MHRYSFLLIMGLALSGCASDTTGKAANDWIAKKEQCIEQEEQSQALFPRNEWFDSLTKQQKIDVVLYIYNLKHQACTEKESLELERSLNKAGYKELGKHFTVLGAFDWPDESALDGIDIEQVNKLSEQVGLLNLGTVGEQLKFRE